MERSFARGTRYGIKRARWRRLWRVSIQEYLTATIQNIMILLRHYNKPLKAVAKRVEPAAGCTSLKRTACPRILHWPTAGVQAIVDQFAWHLLALKASFGQQPVKM